VPPAGIEPAHPAPEAGLFRHKSPGHSGVAPSSLVSSHGPPKDFSPWPATCGRGGLQRATAGRRASQAALDHPLVERRPSAQPVLPDQGRSRALPDRPLRGAAVGGAVRLDDRRAMVVAAAARSGSSPRMGPPLAGRGVARVSAPNAGLGRRGPEPSRPAPGVHNGPSTAANTPSPSHGLAAPGQLAGRRGRRGVAGTVVPPTRAALTCGPRRCRSTPRRP
jgi:hypothetical protein